MKIQLILLIIAVVLFLLSAVGIDPVARQMAWAFMFFAASFLPLDR